MLLEVNATHPEPRKIQKAVELLERDGVIAYPTDTVYGMGCDLQSKKGVERIQMLKRMKSDQPMAFICADLSDITKYAVVSDRNYRLMKRLLPGPYCFILDATRDVPKILHMKRKQVGIRVPNHPVPRALVAALGRPIISTTVTKDGETLLDPHDIDAAYALDLVLDAGGGGLVPTTVLDISGDGIVVVREGAGPVDTL